MKNTLKTLYSGLLFIALITVASFCIADTDAAKSLSISPLIVAILLGFLFGNSVETPQSWGAGIAFAQKRLLRLGIIFFGFRISFQDIANVGPTALALDCAEVAIVLVAGYFLGTRVFGLDRRLSAIISSGSAICGAAAVMATEPTIKAKPHETSLAVATVVIFGTIAMFVFPQLVKLTPLDAHNSGIALGATVHEVAQVVAAGSAISIEATETAVIVKLTRVMLLVPALVVLGAVFAEPAQKGRSRLKIYLSAFPYFALGFVLASAFNSLDILSAQVKGAILTADTFVLAMAMAALGVSTNFRSIKAVGAKPFLLAGSLFVILACILLSTPLYLG